VLECRKIITLPTELKAGGGSAFWVLIGVQGYNKALRVLQDSWKTRKTHREKRIHADQSIVADG
jgi:hypothetical protein